MRFDKNDLSNVHKQFHTKIAYERNVVIYIFFMDVIGLKILKTNRNFDKNRLIKIF